MKTTKPIVYVVHAVDTEGPLHEPLEETFSRLQVAYGLPQIEPTIENLVKLQRSEIPLGGKEARIAKLVAPRLMSFNHDWSDIDKMLARIMSQEFRNSLPDSAGNGWIYSWHCMDHWGYIDNPRRKSVGVHTIFDYYSRAIAKTKSPDKIHWHFHPAHFNADGHHSGTSYLNSPYLYTIICRRMIERNWFPTANRAGYHTERPDSHWFLEQWLPFDLSNQSMPSEDHELSNTGRFGDWRGAPSDWSIYHPSHDHHQLIGSCRRKIARCLNVGTRHHLLTQSEVDRAFARASTGRPTMLSFSDHDFRDMTPNVMEVYEYLTKAAQKFKDVVFKYVDAVEGMRLASFTAEELHKEEKLVLDIKLTGNLLQVDVTSGELFGPQPFLAIQTRDNRFLHDNMDIGEFSRRYFYTFDANTVPMDALKSLAVGSNDRFGNVALKHIRVSA